MFYIKVVRNGMVVEYIHLSTDLTPSGVSTLVSMLYQQHLTENAVVEIYFGRDGEYAIKVKG